MQKLLVEIELGNDAMSRPAHLADALRRVAYELETIGSERLEGPRAHKLYPADSRSIRDINGNRVGTWNIDGMPDRKER